jgi:hypothetical protein
MTYCEMDYNQRKSPSSQYRIIAALRSERHGLGVFIAAGRGSQIFLLYSCEIVLKYIRILFVTTGISENWQRAQTRVPVPHRRRGFKY